MDELIDGSCSISKNDSSSNEQETAIALYHTQFVYQYPPFQIIQYSEVPSDCECMPHITKHIHPKRKNLIAWDWDDTIFPTHSFRTHQHQKNKHFMRKLKILVSIIENIFTEMIKLYGASNIIIVTNASSNWIDKCLNIDIIQSVFMNLQNLLKKHNITIISASTNRIRSKYPTNYYKWKEVAFSELFQKHFNNKDISCITSIGDSLCEYKASDRSSKYLKNRILNRILFKSDPSINDMICQLRQIQCIIDQFGINVNDMDIDYSSSYSSKSETSTV